MSRSNPNDNGPSNPATRWFEWHGEQGVVRYYDKEQKKTIDVGSKFSFVLLDQLGGVRGWHDATGSGIYSNEVKDTRQETLVVKAFKGGVLAEGLYKDIKDRVNAQGGSFVANCYLAYKDDTGTLSIGCLRFKGAALREWMTFTKAHRPDLYTKGLMITGYSEDKKGRIVYRVPTFKTVELSKASNDQALALDAELQTFLAKYLTKNKRDQVDVHVRDEEVLVEDELSPPPITEDDIPF